MVEYEDGLRSAARLFGRGAADCTARSAEAVTRVKAASMRQHSNREKSREQADKARSLC
jgi:hypothetical protein